MTRTETTLLSGVVTLAALVIAASECRSPRPIGAVHAEPECYRRDVAEREEETVEEALRASVRETCHADGCLWCDAWGCSWEAAPRAGECDDAGACPGEGE